MQENRDKIIHDFLQKEQLEDFVRECLYIDKNKNSYFSDVYKRYINFCNIKKIEIYSKKDFIELIGYHNIEVLKKGKRIVFPGVVVLKIPDVYNLPDDYGKIVLTPIETGEQFFSILDRLFEDEETLPPEIGFRNNKRVIVNAFKHDKLYGLSVDETKEMYYRDAIFDKVFERRSRYLLPCFCIVDKFKDDVCCYYLWIRSDIRKQGLGKKFIDLLNIKLVSYPLESALGFWKKYNIKTKNNCSFYF